MRRLAGGTLVTCLALAPACGGVPPAPGQAVWTRIDDTAAPDDRALDLTLCPDGTLAVVGMLGDAPSTTAFVRSYAEDGALRWERTFPRGDASLLSGVAVDSGGDLRVTGAVHTQAEDWDIWVARLDGDGDLLWEKIVVGAAHGEDEGVGVAMGDGETALVAGYVMTSDATTDAWVRAFDGDGNVLWHDEHDGPGMSFDVATEIAWWPGDHRVFATGFETEADDKTRLWMRAYGQGGVVLYDQTHAEADGGDRGASVAVDAAGPIVAGTAVVPGRTVDAWFGRFDIDGQLQWARTHDGPVSLGDGATDVALGPEGEFAVGGYELGTGGAWDLWVELDDASGTPKWTHVYDHDPTFPGDDVVAGVVIGDDGDVYVAGSVATSKGDRAVIVRRIAG